MHLYNFHLKHLKPLRHVSIFSDHHQGILCCLLKLLHIHDLVRFCKQGVVVAYHYIAVHCPDVGGIVAVRGDRKGSKYVGMVLSVLKCFK